MAEEVSEASSRPIRVDRRRRAAERTEDRRRRSIAFGVIGVLLVLVIGLLVAGYVVIFVRPPSELVVRVDDVRYSRGDMVKLLRVRQRGVEYLGGRFNAATDIFQGLQLIVENEIIAQSVPRFGITVSDEEIDAGIRAQFAPVAVAAGKTTDQVEREFQEVYRGYLNAVQISENEHRQLFRRDILRAKTRQLVGESVPTVAEHVHLHRLVLSPNDELDIIRKNYNDAVGVDKSSEHLQAAFKKIVRDFSRDDPETVRFGGDLGWVPSGVLDDYEYRFWNLELGELSIQTENLDNRQQLFLFMVSERDEAREIDPANREILKTRALQDWLNEERDNHDVYAVFDSYIYDWLIEQLGLTSIRTPEADVQPINPFGF